MPSIKNPWFVDYYQLNVAVDHKGDAAIACLMRQEKNKTPVLTKAVLIDAGMGKKSARLIQETIQELEIKYGVDTLLFDSVVISHWDQDHGGGFFEFLNIESLWSQGTNRTFRHFRYTTDDPPKPITCLYCQNWGKNYYTKKLFITKYVEPEPSEDTNFADPHTLAFKLRPQKEVIDNVLLVYHHKTKNLLGCNVFLNQLCTIDQTTITNPAKLLDANDPWAGTMQYAPGLYIIGVMQQTFPPEVKTSIIDTTVKTDINQDSIVLALIWKPRKTDLDPRIALYSGGDAEYQVEKRIASWVGKCTPIEVLKTGHHGSLQGTSPEWFMEKLKPQHVLLSAGVSHHHPVPLWVLYMHLYFTQLEKFASTKPIHSICHPYYLGLVREAGYYDNDTRYYRVDSPQMDVKILRKSTGSSRPAKFIARLKIADPVPITEIQEELDGLDKTLALDDDDVDSLAAKVERQVQALSDANAALQAWTPTNNRTLASFQEKVILETEKLKTYKDPLYKQKWQATMVSKVVARCWNELSDVSVPYLPIHKEYVGPKLVVMQYQKVTFRPNDDPTFERVPDIPSKAKAGNSGNIAPKKKARKTQSVSTSQAHKGRPSGLQPQGITVRMMGTGDPASNKNKRGRETQEKMKVELPASSDLIDGLDYVMSQNDERVVHSVEAQFQDLTEDAMDVESNENAMQAFDASRALPRAPFNQVRTQALADSPRSRFQYIVPNGTVVADEESIALQNTPALSGANRFLRALRDNGIMLAAETTLEKAWTIKLDKSDSLSDWFELFLDSGDPILPQIGQDDEGEDNTEDNAIAQTAESRVNLLPVSTASATEIKLFAYGGSMTDENGGNTVQLSGFQLSFNIAETETNLLFDSAAAQVVNGFNLIAADSEAPLGDFADAGGFTSGISGIAMGLSLPDPTATLAGFKLSDLLHFVGIRDILFLNGDTDLQVYHGKSEIPLLPDPINGIWHYPGSNHSTTITICAASTEAIANKQLIGLGADIPGCSFSNCTISVMKQGHLITSTDTSQSPAVDNDLVSSTSSFCIQAQISLGDSDVLQALQCQVWLAVSPTDISLTMQWDKGQKSTLDDFMTWIQDEASIPHGSLFDDIKKTAQDIVGDLILREATFSSTKNDAGSWVFASQFSLTFEIDLTSQLWGVGDAAVPIMLEFKYAKSGGTTGKTYVAFKGELWSEITPAMVIADRLRPNAPLAPRLLPEATKPQYFIDVTKLGGDKKPGFPEKMTDIVPTRITALSFEISTERVGFSGTLSVAKDQKLATDRKPFLVFDHITISAAYVYGDANAKHLEFSFDAVVVLNPRPLPYTPGVPKVIASPNPASMPDIVIPTPPPPMPDIVPARLEIEITHDGTEWKINGSVRELSAACLYSLLPSENDAVMNVLEHIIIQDLTLEFDYQSASTATFQADGKLKLGPFLLHLTFNHQADGWLFSADLGADTSGDSVTIGEFLGGACKSVIDMLPDFVRDHEFSIPDQTQRASDASPPLRLRCEKMGGFVLLSIIVEIDGFEFSFVQLTPTTVPTADKATPADHTPKRMLRFEMESLPMVDTVPLLAKLTQPFDQMDLIWVSADFTKADVDFLNTAVFTGQKDPLICKPPLDPAKGVLLAKGCHFMVIAQESNAPTVVLDYCFGGGNTSPKTGDTPVKAASTTQQEVQAQDGTVAPVEGAPPDEITKPQPPTNAVNSPWSKTIGPLTISAIGLKIAKETNAIGKSINHLQLTLDATVKFSGVEVALKGFGLSFPMEKGVSFKTEFEGIKILISGLGFSLKEPPLLVAGFMQRLPPDGYAGGIAIEFEPYAFLAMGEYQNMGDYKSIFIILSVDGPIAELEFASLDGLTGGYGYNSHMRLPSVAEVTQHPFISIGEVTRAGGDPMATMTSLTSGPAPWFSPAKGPMWIAAGLNVAAFEVLDIQAVLVVDISSDIVISVFADCTASVPPQVADESERFAFVEMGLLASLNYKQGAFVCSGQLTPKSFVLDRNCHLTGGFTLNYWFEGSGHDGDWVFSIGGYHSSYKPPAWYPVPPRLGISWKYDSNISITGEAYFAVTPKVAMGGGHLALVFQDGNIGAHLDAWADFLINYKPFNFTASMGIDVGASYTAHIFGIVKKWELSIGARLDLHGPPVAGTVHIDWIIISFTVHFGQSDPPREPLDWQAFTKLLQQGSDASKRNASYDALHSLAATGGLLQASKKATASPVLVTPSAAVDALTMGKTAIPRATSQEASSTVPWRVDGTSFKFRFTSQFPIIKVVDSQDTPNTLYEYTDRRTFMKPMQVTGDQTITSEVSIKLAEVGQEGTSRDISHYFTLQPVIKQVPSALWGAYDAGSDPSSGSRTLLDPTDGTVPQIMSLDIGPAVPIESQDIYELNISRDCSENVFATAEPPQPDPVLPAAFSVPGNITSSVNASIPQSKLLQQARETWLPDLSESEGGSSRGNMRAQKATMQGAQKRGFGTAAVVESWMRFKALSKDDEGSGIKGVGTGKRYARLADEDMGIGTVLDTFGEMETLPLPRLGRGTA